MKFLRILAIVLLVPVVLAAFAWAYGALYFDGPSHGFAIVQAAAIVAVFIFVRKWWRKLAVFSAWLAIILVWWFSLKPSNTANWQADVSRKPGAVIDGDVVTLHNVRNFNFQTETEFTESWETRTVTLSKITGIDMFLNYWGSPWIAHPILSFQFSDGPPLCFSIETRKKVGQSYSAIGGLYRQFELIYIAADERDIIRVRTNVRGEDAYLYHLTATPEQARGRFLEYINTINDLEGHPEWYNAIVNNCTTAIRHQHPAAERQHWDWRMLVNGKGDELMYERHFIESNGLPFAELKRRALIDTAAKAAGDSPDFSKLIRVGRPGT